ncbi:hypothetical protein Psi02_13150 [Planotetraspora silvatica]|uniref:Uncharacterized protein n=2 Tax=Planotetraspora silvatica TaxID=234614 RepID=A0A8J3UI29_9ACTN|nr:hypothetical protein Psi02_13150 [Planotetraspora silvatica]
MPFCTFIMAGVLLATGSGTSADPAPAVDAQGVVSAPEAASGPVRGVLSQLAWIDDPMPTFPDAAALHAPTPQDVVVVWPPVDGTVPGSQTLILDIKGHQHASSWSSDDSDGSSSSDDFGFDGSGTGDAGAGYTP